MLRYSKKTHKVEVVDQVGEGEGFGEDALLSGLPRNATVVMATDGLLLRLGREDFNDLLRTPLVKWVYMEEAKAKVRDGACLLDVRRESEFAKGSLEGSINLPLQRLRAELAGLGQGREYIVCCQNGKQSCAAAFILINQGFTVSVLRDGLDEVEPW